MLWWTDVLQEVPVVLAVPPDWRLPVRFRMWQQPACYSTHTATRHACDSHTRHACHPCTCHPTRHGRSKLMPNQFLWVWLGKCGKLRHRRRFAMQPRVLLPLPRRHASCDTTTTDSAAADTDDWWWDTDHRLACGAEGHTFLGLQRR